MILSIIIPTKNEALNIARVIESILYSPAFNPENIEIVVVDNPGTTDSTMEIVGKYPVRLEIIGPERSSQRNRGVEVSSGEYLCFIDADMEFTPDLLPEIVSNLTPNTALVIPERIPGNSLYSRALNIEKQIYDKNNSISAVRIFPRKVFTSIGGFRSDMISGEDWELDKRYKQFGGKVIHLKNHLLHNEENIGFIKSIHKKIYYAQKLKHYNVGVQTEVNPLYRYALLFSKPYLILKNPFVFIYLLTLKTAQFSIGVITYISL